MASWLKRCWRAIRRFGGTHAPDAVGGAQATSPHPGPLQEAQIPVHHRDPAPRKPFDQPAKATPGAVPAPPSTRDGLWRRHRFAWEGRQHNYWLFHPGEGATAGGLPLVVMLHGCKQDAADFARGTGMNRLAQAQRCLVLYPEQSSKANRMRCWNWFDKAHQGHAGEPAMLAALTRQVAQQHGADPQRIYIAGLSAGGAMAAVVAALYTDIFAALGVHSGIPAGAASDVISAFTVMRRGASAPRPFAGRRQAVMPTIVFHGSADDVVHPDNSEQLTEAARLALEAAGLSLTCVENLEGGKRPARVARWLDVQGRSQLEQWTVDTGPHAWSGGDPSGSFTDPHGPDASRWMLAFFLQHRRT